MKNFISVRSYHYWVVFGAFVLAVQFWGCSKKSDDDADADVEPSASATASPSPTASASDLVGTWTGGCSTTLGYYKDTFVFTTTGVTTTRTTYSDTTCTTATARNISTYTYALGDAASVTDAFNIDLTIVTVKVTPLAATTVSTYNMLSTCGTNTWVLNTEKEITGMTCNGYRQGAGDKVYSIYKVSGTSYYNGLGSAANDGTTAAKRINSLETVAATKS